MHSYDDDVLCIIYILQITIGILGNGLLIHLYGSNLISSQKTRPIDLIIINLAFSHILMIFFRGVPWAIQACIQKVFLGDIGCKLIVYLQRVSRSLSLCTTCLMSFFQAITITSCSSKWTKLKTRAPQCILSSCVFIWILNLLVEMNSTDSTVNINLGYCSINKYAMTTLKVVFWKTFYDVAFVGLMTITSGYMVLVLYRHHQQIQYLHDRSLTLSASPETRATKVILFLVSIFAFFYLLSSIFTLLMDHSKYTNRWVMYSSPLLTLCYPTLSPFVLISCDSKIPHCFKALKRMKNVFSHQLIF